MEDPISAAQSAEAVNAAANHAEAIERARSSQMRAAVVDGMQEIIDSGRFIPIGTPKYADVQRFQRICEDVRDIKNTLWWMSRIASVVGMAVLLLVCALIATIRIHL